MSHLPSAPAPSSVRRGARCANTNSGRGIRAHTSSRTPDMTLLIIGTCGARASASAHGTQEIHPTRRSYQFALTQICRGQPLANVLTRSRCPEELHDRAKHRQWCVITNKSRAVSVRKGSASSPRRDTQIRCRASWSSCSMALLSPRRRARSTNG